MKKISKNIRAIRLLRNLKQENIAEDLGMSQQNYSKIERGDQDIKFSKLEAIANVLGVEIEDILSFDDKIIFNIHNNTNSNNGVIINQSRMKEEENITNQIKELKAKISVLENKLEKL
ncbi:helix-turn-helix domain-containing protein [Runella sp.]|uniref:helix-turn-helix domain-containing protein n=1 Tax=Runella sp. TaxID=1960881 RepID=UPI003D11C93D